MDFINKQYLLAEIDDLADEFSEVDENGLHSERWCGISDAKRVVMNAPSVSDRPQGWIPCSERLPKASITAPCLMTIIFPRVQAVEIAYGYRYHENVWEYATFEGYEYTENGIAEVVAWMPLPNPWKGANDE